MNFERLDLVFVWRVCLDLGFAEQFVVGGSVYLDPRASANPRFKHILGLHI